MVRRSLEERIAQLEAQKKTLQSRLSKQERAKDTRRKILLGALVLDRVTNHRDPFSAQLAQWVQAELPGFLTREADMELFDYLLTTLKAGDGGEAQP